MPRFYLKFLSFKSVRHIINVPLNSTNEKTILKTHKVDVVHDNIPCTLFGNLRELHTARIANRYKVPFILHCRWEKLPVGDKRSELIDEEFKIVKEILEMKPAEIYRNHIKVGETADE